MEIFKYTEATLIDSETGSDFRLISSLKQASPIHGHDFYEIFLVIKGSAIHKANNGAQYLKEGSLVFIRPDDIHCYEYDGGNDCQFINIPYSCGCIKKVFDFLGDAFSPQRLLLPDMPPICQLSRLETESFIERFEKLQIMPLNNKPLISMHLRSLFIEVFSKYFSEMGSTARIEYPLWLESLLTAMQKKENFTAGLKRMYEMSGRSTCHLNRTFKYYFDVTPTEYINTLRLNYARYLLITTRLSIIEISMDSGFNNLSHFYHLFKKRFHMAPSGLRKGDPAA